MAFKLKAPYKIDNTPRYEKKEEPGVLGRANKNGTIVINCDIKDPKQREIVDKHEIFFIKFLKDISKYIKKSNSIICEIGAGYGVLASKIIN